MARFLLDTNVLSELSRRQPAPAVTDWLRRRPPQDIATSVIVIGEILHGILRLEPREPAQALHLRRWLEEIEATHLVLPIDEPAIREWAKLRAMRAEVHDFEHLLIAATALAHRMAIVTRNVNDFAPLGVEVLDPWQA